MNQPITFLEHVFNTTRIKALLWHTLGQLLGFGLADLATAVSNHTIIVPAWAAVALGLIIGQVTKAVTNYFATKQAILDAQVQ